MKIDIDDLEQNIRRYGVVTPMIAAALIEELRRLEAEHERVKALLAVYAERLRRAKLL